MSEIQGWQTVRNGEWPVPPAWTGEDARRSIQLVLCAACVIATRLGNRSVKPLKRI
jgi:hypothetical protein